MRTKNLYEKTVLTLALAGVISPQFAMAVGPASASQRAVTTSSAAVAIRDVTLHEGGVLYGQVVDAQGSPAANSSVRIQQQEKLIATATTDKDGRFAVREMRGGVYQIETAQGAGLYRLWSPRTAPPAAQQVAFIAQGHEIARGQAGDGRYGPALRGAVAGALLGAGLFWAFDYNAEGS